MFSNFAFSNLRNMGDYQQRLNAFLRTLISSLPASMSFTRASSVTVPDNLAVLQTVGNNVPAFENLRLSYLLSDGATLGPELAINGGFDTATFWTAEAGWSISGGLANATATGAWASINQDAGLVFGKTYQVQYQVLNYVSGGVQAMAGAFTGGVLRSANGIYTEIMNNTGIASATQLRIEAYPATFTGSIDNISVKEITPVWLTTAIDGITPLTSQGALNEPGATSIYANGLAPATQSIAVTAQAYTLSFYGTGSIVYSGVASGTLTGTGATNRVQVTFTPTAGSLTLTLSGSVTSSQLETGVVATSPMIGAGVTTTRAPSVFTITSPALPASGAWVAEVKLRSKVNSAQIVTPMAVGGSYFDANNYTWAFLDNTYLRFRKVIAGLPYDAWMPLTVTTGQVLSILTRVNSDGTTDVFANGVKGTGNTNTIQPIHGALWSVGNDGQGANQWLGSIVSAGTKPGAFSDAQCLVLTV